MVEGSLSRLDHPAGRGTPAAALGGARWLRGWCQALLAHYGLAAFAEAVKRGDLAAIRLALAYAYGNPAVDPPDDEEEGADVGLAIALDLRGAEAAVAPAPPPREKTRREEIEEAVLAEARPKQNRPIDLLLANLSEDAFRREVAATEEEDRRRGGRRE
jgi:hypothetical protein